MANLNGRIDGLVAGDDLEVRRTITGIPTTYGIDMGWFTVKTEATDGDPHAIFQKVITTLEVAAQGHVSDTGITDGVGIVRFYLQDIETVLLAPGTEYYYDIQIREATTLKLWTPEIGRLVVHQQITQATA